MTFLSRILITLVNIPISILVARTLGPEGQGAYSAVLTFTTLWGTTFLLGIDTAHTYYLAGKRYPLRQLIAHSWVWSLVLGAAATPLYYWVSPWLIGGGGGAAETTFRAVLSLSAIAVPLTMAKYFLLAAFLGEGRIDRFNLLQVLSNLALLALLVATLVWFRGGIAGAVWAYLGSLVVFLLLGGVWMVGRVRDARAEAGGWNPELARRSLAYGLKGHLGTIVAAMTYRLDQLLVTRMLGLEAQGLYSIAVLLAEKLSHVPASIQLVLFPRVSASTPEQANRVTPAACRLTLAGVTLAAIPLWLLSEPILRLFYGAEFLPALPPLRILLPGVVLLAVGKVLAGDLSGRDRRLASTVALSLAFLCNLGLDLLWIPRYGIVGAAWASNVAYAAQTAFLALLFWRISGVSPLQLFWPQREDLERLRALAAALRRDGAA